MPHCTFICGEEGPAAPLPGGRYPPTAPPEGAGYLPPGRGAAGSPRGQNANKCKFYLHLGPYRPAGGRQGSGRPAAGR